MRAEHSLLEHLVEPKPPTRVTPRELFISWSGVPTLAYRGFSPTLLAIKEEIERTFPGMKPENPGARWPKTTLGALRDEKTLSLQEARTLRRICDELQPVIGAGSATLEISALSLVVFQCRSLERRLLTHVFQLRGDEPGPGGHEPPAAHAAAVGETMDQFSSKNLEAYLPRLQAPGNRERHYRETHLEATLVVDLGEQQPGYLDDFIAAVDQELPDAYRWFAPASRHMTVRGLGG